MTTTGKIQIPVPVNNPEDTKSKGHLFFLEGYEYFIRQDNEGKDQLYRANVNNVFSRMEGQRLGARWQVPEHLINDYLFLLGMPATYRKGKTYR